VFLTTTALFLQIGKPFLKLGNTTGTGNSSHDGRLSQEHKHLPHRQKPFMGNHQYCRGRKVDQYSAHGNIHEEQALCGVAHFL
jgi:hypothetical protein